MSEANLPIDIHAHKLLDWLVSRRHVEKDWMKSLQNIRSMIIDALRDMPEDPRIASLLSSGNQVNYYTCKQIVEILKQTEADSKNIFGYYSSQRMKDWQEIVKSYEKSNVYMAEIAQIINRNVAFEVPSMKRAITKADAMTDDLRKKAADCIKRSGQLQQQFLSSVEALGITSKNPKKELLEQLEQFPILVDSIEEQVKQIAPIRDFYVQFVQATLEGLDDQTQSQLKPSKLCPIICYLASKSNTTYYEYIHGTKPDVIESITNQSEAQSTNEEEDAIDFGDNEIEDTIDFGDVITSTDNANGNGSSNGTSSDGFVHVNDSEVGSRKDSIESVEEVISWDIDVAAQPEPSIESGSQSTLDNRKVARGIEALSIIECNITREQLLDELYELESFLQQRLHNSTSISSMDLSTVTSILYMNCTNLTQLLQQKDAQELKSMGKKIASAVTSLTNDRIKVLYLIRDNPKYIEKTIAKLTEKQNLAQKALITSKKCEEEINKIIKDRNEILEKIQPLIQFTQELEDQIASDISQKYKGRPVNIMAGSCIL